jgi:NAD(P)-dependent dehydrogenase (short-subunit alcohol dehydrogenase family)
MSQNNALTYSGKTTLISGAAGGIGFALAKEFGELGMNVVIADIDEAALASAKKQLESLNIKVLACKLDVTDFTQWQACVEQTLAAFGKLHMVVNNAGVGGVPGKIEQADHDIWRWVVDVNLMGVVYGAQVAIPEIKRHGEGGWIINVASMAGMMGVPYASSYSATKAAGVSLTESWAVELKSHNIHVSALCPAFVKLVFMSQCAINKINISRLRNPKKLRLPINSATRKMLVKQLLLSSQVLLQSCLPSVLLKLLIQGKCIYLPTLTTKKSPATERQ